MIKLAPTEGLKKTNVTDMFFLFPQRGQFFERLSPARRLFLAEATSCNAKMTQTEFFALNHSKKCLGVELAIKLICPRMSIDNWFLSFFFFFLSLSLSLSLLMAQC